MKKYKKHLILMSLSGLLILLLIISGCSFLGSSKRVIKMEDFRNLISGNFNTIPDVLNLFPRTIEDINYRIKFLETFTKEELNKILGINAEDRTFDNTVRALDNLENQFSVGSHALSSFEMVCPNKSIRDACHNASIELSNFAVETFFNKEIYTAFIEFLDNKGKEEVLNNEEKYFLDESLKNFKRAGFNLSKDEFNKVKGLKKELSQLALEFDKNINIDNSFIEVEKKDLTGMNLDFINRLKKTDSGKIVLKCDYPTYFGIMDNCTNATVRKDLYFLFQNRAYPENLEILNAVINKRDELAGLLGYKSYADLDLDSEMVKTSSRAREFLRNLVSRSMLKMEKEFEELTKELPESVHLDDEGKMSPWDYRFVNETYKKRHFNVDETKIAEYFPVDHTINKIFEIYQKFLSLKFEIVSVDGLWDKDVKFVKVFDKDSKNLKGYLFLDLFPRENKYSHACMIDLVSTYKYKEIDVPAVIMVIGNFPKATKGKPALLTHNDVETFFHEFGHAMHGLLGKTEMAGYSGTNVKRDFVEMPSQMFEEWLFDKDILKMVSSHYKTGESLPDELIDKKIELKRFDSGYFVTRQSVLSLIALNYFSEGQNKDTDNIQKELWQKYIKQLRFEPKTHFQASFGHLMGYAAKYYGYMWSKVFALDLFYKIKKEGLLNPKVGQKLINLVLYKGGSVDPDTILKEYLGREPNQKAFLKDLGIE